MRVGSGQLIINVMMNLMLPASRSTLAPQLNVDSEYLASAYFKRKVQSIDGVSNELEHNLVDWISDVQLISCWSLCK